MKNKKTISLELTLMWIGSIVTSAVTIFADVNFRVTLLATGIITFQMIIMGKYILIQKNVDNENKVEEKNIFLKIVFGVLLSGMTNRIYSFLEKLDLKNILKVMGVQQLIWVVSVIIMVSSLYSKGYVNLLGVVVIGSVVVVGMTEVSQTYKIFKKNDNI